MPNDRNLTKSSPQEPPEEGLSEQITAWVEQWVLPYLGEPALWPVLVALLGHVVVVLTPLMLAVWRVHSLFAAVLLLVAVGVTGWLLRLEFRRKGAPGLLAATAALTWLVSVLFAVFCERTGVL